MDTDEFLCGLDTEVPEYEAPTLVELGDVVELTNGTASKDTADMATSKYW